MSREEMSTNPQNFGWYQKLPAAEVTFKYYLPAHEDEIWIHANAQKMYELLYELDQKMRSITKYEDIPEDHPRHMLADEVREFINAGIDLNRVQ